MSTPEARTPGWSPANADNKTDSTPIIGDSLNLDKVERTLQAQFARAGHAMDILRYPDKVLYRVSRWGQAREFYSLHAAMAFYAQIGGAA